MAGDEQNRVQNIIVENRKRMTVSGVREVDGFDESYVQMHTVQGELVIRGEGLRVDQLSVETGELLLTGKIDELSYGETREERGFFSRLFG